MLWVPGEITLGFVRACRQCGQPYGLPIFTAKSCYRAIVARYIAVQLSDEAAANAGWYGKRTNYAEKFRKALTHSAPSSNAGKSVESAIMKWVANGSNAQISS